MTTNDTTYNGWTNYETWNVNLWMDNEEGSQRYYSELAQECWNDADGLSAYAKFTGNEIFTRDERAAQSLADRIKGEYEEAMADWLEESGKTASVWADLLGASLSEVNWREIAESLLADVDKTAPEPVDESDDE